MKRVIVVACMTSLVDPANFSIEKIRLKRMIGHTAFTSAAEDNEKRGVA